MLRIFATTASRTASSCAIRQRLHCRRHGEAGAPPSMYQCANGIGCSALAPRPAASAIRSPSARIHLREVRAVRAQLAKQRMSCSSPRPAREPRCSDAESTGAGGGIAARTAFEEFDRRRAEVAICSVVQRCADSRSENSPGVFTQSTSSSAGDKRQALELAPSTSLRCCGDSALMNVNCASTSCRSAGNFQS